MKAVRVRARLKIAANVAALSAIAVGMGWVSARYRRDMRHARARVARGGRVVQTPCGAVEYAEAGDGPALLVIHGAGGGYDQGLTVAGAFASDHRVIAPSRFGYLGTPAPEHPSLALQAEAHRCLLDILGVQEAAVMGISAGAPSAIEFALRHPERCTRLILLVPAWAGPMPPPPAGLRRTLFERIPAIDFLYWGVSHLAPAIVQQTMLGTPSAVLATAPPSERERLATVMQEISPLSRRKVGLSLEARLIEETRTQALEQIGMPVLVISAEDDGYGTYENAQRLANRIPHGRFLGYRTGGHLLIGHQAESGDAIAAFLADQIPVVDTRHAPLHANPPDAR